MAPAVIESKSQRVIQTISFDNAELCNFEGSNEQIYDDYLDMIKKTNTSRLIFSLVRCSKKNVCLIDTFNDMWIWGENQYGQCGNGRPTKFIRVPFCVSKFIGRTFMDACAGITHTLAIDKKKQLFVWGNDAYGCHGIQENGIQYQPKKINKQIFQLEQKFHADLITASDNFSLVVINSKILSFGKENKGRLGLNQDHIDFTDKPYIVDLPKTMGMRHQVCGLNVGLNHCLCWDSSGALYSWGDNDYGKAGHPVLREDQSTKILSPTRVTALSEVNIILASAGYNHSCALTSKGQVYQWGNVQYEHKQKAFFDPDVCRPRVLEPQVSISGAQQGKVHFVKLSCYGNHNAAVDQYGILYTWGRNLYNCLGHDDQKDYFNPTLVRQLSKYRVIALGCGEDFTVISAQSSIRNQNFSRSIRNLPDIELNSIKERIFTGARQIINKVQAQNFVQNKKTTIIAPLKYLDEKTINPNIKHPLTVSDLRTTNKRDLDLFVRSNERLKIDSFHSKEKYNQILLKNKNIQATKSIHISLNNIPKKKILTAPQTPAQIIFDSVTDQVIINYQHFFEAPENNNEAIEEAEMIIFRNQLDEEIKNNTKPNLILHGFKGIPVQSNFQEEIDNIYKDYNKSKPSLISKVTKKKKKQFQRQNSPIKSPINNQLNSSFHSKLTIKSIKDLNFQTPSPPHSVYSEEDQEDLQFHFTNNHQKINQLKEDRKKELKIKGQIRDYKIQVAQKRKETIIQQKAKNIEKQYLYKNADYQKYIQEKNQQDRQNKQKQSNWFIFLNMELMIQFFKKSIQAYHQQIKLFKLMNKSASKIQIQFRKLMVRKRAERMTPKQRLRLQLMLFKFVFKFRIQRKGFSARKIKRQMIFDQLKRKVKISLNRILNQTSLLQSFVKWTIKQSEHKVQLVSQLWDQNVLHISKLNEFQKKQDMPPEQYQKIYNVLLSKQEQKINPEISNFKNQQFDEYIQNRLTPFQEFILQTTHVQALEDRAKKQALQQSRASNSCPVEQKSDGHKFSLLPFTQHAEFLILPTTFLLRLEAIKKSESTFEIACSLESSIKLQMIQQIVIDARIKFIMIITLTQKYTEQKNQFIRENKDLIDLQRAKLLLQTPLGKLQQIHRKQTKLTEQKRSKRDNYFDPIINDHLPYGELKSALADKLPNAPQKPGFKIALTNDLFRKYFAQYHSNVKKKLYDLEQKLKFPGVIKK